MWIFYRKLLTPLYFTILLPDPRPPSREWGQWACVGGTWTRTRSLTQQVALLSLCNTACDSWHCPRDSWHVSAGRALLRRGPVAVQPWHVPRGRGVLPRQLRVQPRHAGARATWLAHLHVSRWACCAYTWIRCIIDHCRRKMGRMFHQRQQQGGKLILIYLGENPLQMSRKIK